MTKGENKFVFYINLSQDIEIKSKKYEFL